MDGLVLISETTLWPILHMCATRVRFRSLYRFKIHWPWVPSFTSVSLHSSEE